MDIIVAQSLLEPNAGLIFYKVIVFALLLFVLGKYAWKPIVSALSEREETIDASLRKAEQALEEARQTGEKNEEARRAAEENARRVMHDARAAAERMRTEEMEKTRVRIRQMQEQAQAEIEREKGRALEELRDEVAGLAIGTAEQILEETLNADRHRKLVDRFIEQLPRN